MDLQLKFNNMSNSNISITTTDGGDIEKFFAMILLGLGSFCFGIFPLAISERNRRRFPLSISLLLCFGAGVLLATALVHILPEVRQQMGTNFAEIALCGGFFIIYFIDEFIHFFFGEAIQHTHHGNASQSNHYAHNQSNVAQNYGAISTERQPLLQAASNSNVDSIYVPDAELNPNHNHNHSHDAGGYHSHLNVPHNRRRQSICNDQTIEDANARICHTNHTEPCVQTMTGTLGLLVALSLHSAIEGLAIGVQNSAKKVLVLLGAVACHKFVMAFCLGLVFRSNPQTSRRSHIIGIFLFAFGAIAGIGVGMLILEIPNSQVLPIIQAIAGGTLFYVTVCEVMPKEKARWHQNSQRRLAGFAQFFAICFGFTIMCLINYFLDES